MIHELNYWFGDTKNQFVISYQRVLTVKKLEAKVSQPKKRKFDAI